MKIEGTERNADDAISIGVLDERGAPPPGNYLVDDKFGADPFKQDQAQRYSSFLEREGKMRTIDGKEYDGVVYFFNSEQAARTAGTSMNNNSLSSKIYIGYYDNQGNLQWLLWRNL